jgi:hypothetical protein
MAYVDSTQMIRRVATATTQTAAADVPLHAQASEAFVAGDMVVLDLTASPVIRRAKATDTNDLYKMGVAVKAGDLVSKGTDGKLYFFDLAAWTAANTATVTNTAATMTNTVTTTTETSTVILPLHAPVTEAFVAGDMVVLDLTASPVIRRATATDTTDLLKMGVAVKAGDLVYKGTDDRLYFFDAAAWTAEYAPTIRPNATNT